MGGVGEEHRLLLHRLFGGGEGRFQQLALLQFPRIVGWEDPDVLDRQLQELGVIVEQVPVYVARLPWGPPFSPSLATDILGGLGLARASH